MTDYYQLIARAVTSLGKNTDEARRAALYARARGALVIELCGVTPPLSEPEIERECLLFEQAIRKIEANFTHHPSSAAAVPAPLPTALEQPQQEPLIPEQDGPTSTGREPSAEAYIPGGSIQDFSSLGPSIEPYIPGGSIRDFGSLEPSIEARDQWIPACSRAARSSRGRTARRGKASISIRSTLS